MKVWRGNHGVPMLVCGRRRCTPVGSLLVLFGVAMPADFVAAQVIRGAIRDTTTGAPLSSAWVAMMDRTGDTIKTMVARVDGTFVMVAPAWGDYVISIIRLGYQPLVRAPVELHTGDTLQIAYHMQRLAVALDPLVVEAESMLRYRHVQYLQKEGFYDRWRSSFRGRFIDPAAIERRRKYARRADDFLAGQNLVGNIHREYRLLGCGRPALFIDGKRFIGDDLDQAIPPEDVLAIETHDRSYVPAPFNTQCAIIVWTRRVADEEGGR